MRWYPGSIFAGKYRLEERLGEGGMGVVFRARHLTMDLPVALKVMHVAPGHSSESARRFLSEAKTLAKVKHPGVVRITDAGEVDGVPWLCMELLEGETLRERLERERPSEASVMKWADFLLDALRAVHAREIVHRDLKPENIFIEILPSGEQRLKLLDFGLAKTLSADGSSFITRTGMAMGTPHYLAPEQAIEAKDVDARADIYAVGVILYEALSGRMPFEAGNFAELVAKIHAEDPEPLANLLPNFPETCLVIDRCLSRDRNARPESVATLRRLLGEAYGNDMPTGTYPLIKVPPLEMPPEMARRSDTSAATALTREMNDTVDAHHDTLSDEVVADTLREDPATADTLPSEEDTDAPTEDPDDVDCEVTRPSQTFDGATAIDPLPDPSIRFKLAPRDSILTNTAVTLRRPADVMRDVWVTYDRKIIAGVSASLVLLGVVLGLWLAQPGSEASSSEEEPPLDASERVPHFDGVAGRETPPADSTETVEGAVHAEGDGLDLSDLLGGEPSPEYPMQSARTDQAETAETADASASDDVVEEAVVPGPRRSARSPARSRSRSRSAIRPAEANQEPLIAPNPYAH